jgi:N-acetylglucosaminyl-diphospho-decaprenol L-rhamnosyltransferase
MTRLTISIVSHGHAMMMERLTETLLLCDQDLELILTINAPNLEPAAWLAALRAKPRLVLRVNEHPLGFGANHNRAAALAQGRFFCVLNPDVSVAKPVSGSDQAAEIWTRVLKALMDSASSPAVGLAYPSQTDAAGQTLDYERALVTPLQIAKRYLKLGNKSIDSVDWVSGCCMMIRTEFYKMIGGFDERYHLYCEDVDLCLRLQLGGYALAKAPTAIIHHTQRKTLKNHHHLLLHAHSLLKLWLSPVFWRYLSIKK